MRYSCSMIIVIEKTNIGPYNKLPETEIEHLTE